MAFLAHVNEVKRCCRLFRLQPSASHTLCPQQKLATIENSTPNLATTFSSFWLARKHLVASTLCLLIQIQLLWSSHALLSLLSMLLSLPHPTALSSRLRPGAPQPSSYLFFTYLHFFFSSLLLLFFTSGHCDLSAGYLSRAPRWLRHHEKHPLTHANAMFLPRTLSPE